MTRPNYAVVFPGQGAQVVGMGQEIMNNYAVADKIYRDAETFTNLDIKNACFKGPDELLQETHITQPCLLTTSMAIYKVFESYIDEKPSYYCGHSAGEYAALCASGVLSFESALNLIQIRGRLMQQMDEGGMLAIKGLEEKEILQLCKEAVQDGGSLIPANWNSPNEVVISGDLDSIEHAMFFAVEHGIKVIPLPVSGAFHSPLMERAATEFRKHINNVPFYPSKRPIVTNVTGTAGDQSTNWSELLVEQITSPVKWQQSISYLYEQGIRLFVEVGPGCILSKLIKKTVPDAQVLNVSGLSTLENTLDVLNVKQNI